MGYYKTFHEGNEKNVFFLFLRHISAVSLERNLPSRTFLLDFLNGDGGGWWLSTSVAGSQMVYKADKAEECFSTSPRKGGFGNWQSQIWVVYYTLELILSSLYRLPHKKKLSCKMWLLLTTYIYRTFTLCSVIIDVNINANKKNGDCVSETLPMISWVYRKNIAINKYSKIG